jgi:NADH:ubiquinone oxidoreductase subunit 5 (subunit L)/multisubunit Na+/H+ antiporter MnhA subunit
MRVLEERVQFQLCVAVLLSVSATGIMTTLLLYSQRRQHEEWVRAQRVFLEEQIRKQQLFESKQRLREKERLWEFLRKLCDQVKDQIILPEYIYKELYNEDY